MVNIAIITPHGGQESDLERTLSSVASCAISSILHLVIINNNAKCSRRIVLEGMTEFLDINPIACRAAARNAALDYLVKVQFQGYVLFLDSGDTLHRDIKNLLKLKLNADAYWGNVIIKSKDKTYLKYKLPQYLLSYVNVFYLGSVLIKFELIKHKFFEAGRKEDWKYWTVVLNEADITNSNEIFYTYEIHTKKNHYKRKMKLYRDQWQFFRRFKKFSFFHSVFAIIFHYCINFYVWAFLNEKLDDCT